jgi:capsular polysaccharide biosynthesis protein
MFRLSVAVTALAVLLAGATYALVHAPSYESRASIALVPKRRAPRDLDTFFGADTIAAAAGTYLELVASPTTLSEPRFRGVHETAEDVPDTSVYGSGTLTRAIEVTTRSRRRQAVQPALFAVIADARRRERELDDLWDIRTLSSPSAPQRFGPTRARIAGASVLLSLLAALVLSTLIGQFGSRRRAHHAAASRSFRPTG